MHPNQLKRFMAVAAAGNLRRAALQLHISQPALTQSLHALEQSLGEQLFERSARGMTLTDCGRALLPRARFILSEFERITDDVAAIRSRKAARLAVGVGPYFTRHIFPTATARTLERFPDAELQIVDGHTTELATLLTEGAIDLAFCVHNPRLDADEGLQFEDTYTEIYSVMARAGHPLFRRKRSSDADLTRYPWVVHDSQAIGPALGQFFEKRRLPPPRWSVSTLSLPAMLGLLTKSDLLALVPRDFARPDLDARRLRIVTGHALQVQGRGGLLTRRDAPHGTAALEIMQQLRDACQQAIGGLRQR